MMVLTTINNLKDSSVALYAIQGTILVGFGFFVVKQVHKWRRNRKNRNYPKDVVILHQFNRGLRAPNPSPFAVKLETWLRMANIKYQNDFTIEKSPKGKSPWITFNGMDIGDSQLIIEFLIKYFDKDLSNHLNPLEKSMARAYLKLNEESIRWTGLVHRFKYGKPEDCGIPAFIFKFAARSMLKDVYGQGYGRHSKEEVYDIGIKDLDALETFLGNKKFLMGDKVCNEDASIFGVIAQLINHDRGPFNEHFKKNCPKLKEYYETMKNLYWPDWNECIREKKNCTNK